MEMELNCKGKVVLVSGGTGGIGREVCRAFVDEGAIVYFTFNSNEQKANEFIAEIKEQLPDACIYGLKLDISQLDACEQVVQTIAEREEHIDILVNNAGITKDGLMLSQSSEKWRSVVEVNLFGTYNLIKNVAFPMFAKHKGCIINISSVAGVIGVKGQTNYCASKSAIIGMTKALCKEFEGKNIRVNAVAPGYIETEMTKELKGTDKLKMSIPLKRFGSPKEIANTVLFLASDAAEYINGTVIVVDGGLLS